MPTLPAPAFFTRLSAMRALLGASVVLWACCASTAQAAGPTGLLNDTGQTQCNNGSDVMAACTVGNAGDAATYKGQDGRFGRDRAAPAKVGGGAAGFDFTKVCMDGSLNCAGTANTGASPALTDWACTKDNVTNLIWSLQTQLTVTWNAASAGAYPVRCGTGTPWRLPTRSELLGIVLFDGSTPAIDASYFPSTQSSFYWASDTFAPGPSLAWTVNFDFGYSNPVLKTNAFSVRLVRDGQ